MNSGWHIVTNGKKFRLINNKGDFYREYVPNCLVTLYLIMAYDTIEEARTKLAELEQKERDDTWVLVDEPE